jgi:carboxylesterase
MYTVGCLIIHGFAGDVQEVLPLARHLRELGYMIECPTLEGHGVNRRTLGRSTRKQWINSAEEAYKRLAMRADRIVVIGFSMGGLLAFQIASRYPVELLFTINTPYYYWDLRQALHNVRDNPRLHLPRYIRGMTRIPLRSMVQFRLLLGETKRLLPKVTCPCVILQAKRDDTVKWVSAEHLAKIVGCQPAVAYFANSGHLLLLDKDAGAAIDFITRTLQERGLTALTD